MRKILLTLFGTALFAISGVSQPVNVAPAAVATHSGGSGDYGPQHYNDQYIHSDVGGITGNIFGWISNGGWIEFNWDTPQVLQDIVFYYADRGNRKVSEVEVQVYDSSLSAYVTILNVTSGLGGPGVQDTLRFPHRITTTNLRLNNIRDRINGGNPAFREIEIYRPTLTPENAGITEIRIDPASCAATYPVYATLRNDGTASLNSAVVYWSVDGVEQPYISYNSPPLETIEESGNFEVSLNLGNYSFSTDQTYIVKVWSSEPNGAIDTVNGNDTLIFNYSLGAPTNLSVSNPTPSSIDVNWNAALSTSYLIIYGPDGFNPSSEGNSVSGMTSSPYTLGGLTENTAYQLYIVAACAGGNSDTAGPVSFTTHCNPGSLLSGTYTINNSQPTGGRNYSSFKEAASDLGVCGVSGPVVFNIAEGTYNDSLVLGEIANISETNTVVFQADPSNTQPVILQSNTTSSGNYVIQIDGTDHLTIKGLTLTAVGTTYGRVIEFRGMTEHVLIENNIINGIVYSSTSTNGAVVYNNSGSSHMSNYITIRNNEIRNGTYAFYWYGGSSSEREKGNVIENNDIRNFSYYGISSYYQDSATIKGNSVISSDNASSTVYGINCNYNDYVVCTENRITVKGSSTNYGLYLQNSEGSTGTPNLLANNMVSLLNNSSGTYGVYVYNSSYADVVYNSVLANKGSATTGRALYVNGTSSYVSTNLRILNNSFVNTGGGFAVEFSTNGIPVNSQIDYNNIYATGSILAKYGSKNVNDILRWTSESGFDGNSVSGNPFYAAEDDLHPLGAILNGKGMAFPAIQFDIDGDSRPLAGSSKVDIGADEYNISGCPDIGGYAVGVVDVGSATIILDEEESIYEIEADTSDFTLGTGRITTTGTGAVTVTGLSPLTYYDIYVRRNCGTDTSEWLGPITVFTECLPSSRLSGTYTINKNQPTGGMNYNSFAEAAYDLNNCGISGPVVFDVIEGVYNEQILLEDIYGTSMTNTIVFRNAASNTQPAEISYNSSSTTNNYIILFDGASYVTVRGLVLSATNSTYARVLDFRGVSNYIIIENNILNGRANPTSTSTNIAVIMNHYNETEEDRISHSVIRHNQINGGSYGMYWYGIGSGPTEREEGNIIDSNIVTGYYNYGITTQYQDNHMVRGNIITSASTPSTTAYGLRHYYCDRITSTGNKIVIYGRTTVYGLDVSEITGTPDNRSVVANNMVSALNNSGTVYGLDFGSSNNIDIVFNSILVNAGSATNGRALYATGGSGDSNVRILNNNFVNTGGGLAAFVTSGAADYMISEMDNNNYYFTGEFMGSWAGDDVYNIESWRALSSMDMYSTNSDAGYISEEELYATSLSINNKGIPVSGLTIDIDGVMRSASPDIGASEFAYSSGDCAPFSDFHSDSLTSSSIKIDWTPGSGNASYYLEYGQNGFSPGNGTLISGSYPGSQPPVYITGLNYNTKYDIYFGEFCSSGTDSSSLEHKVSFRTKQRCPDIGLPVEVIYKSADSIAISFAADEFDQDFEFEYGPSGFGQGSGTFVQVGNPGGVGGLTAYTPYDFYIRNACTAGGNSVSAWYGPVTVMTACGASLSGVYTINSSLQTSGRNFNSFEALIAKLEICGVSGPVTINVASGSYTEQVEFGSYEGVSADNPIIIQADPANTSPAELTYIITSSSGDNYVWSFKDASHITLKGLTLTSVDPAGNSSTNRVITFTGNNKHIIIEDNTLISGAIPTYESPSKSLIYGGTNSATDIVIRNNVLNGGSYGVNLDIGEFGDLKANIVIDSNFFNGFYHSAVYINYTDSVSIRENEIISAVAPNGIKVYGLFLSSSSNMQIENNKIVLTGGGSVKDFYGIELYYCSSISYNPNIVANNMISILDNTGEAIGIHNERTEFTDVVYNSVYINAASLTTGCALYSVENSGDYGIRIVNNNFVNTGGGPAARVIHQNRLQILEMDYNNYYSTGPVLIDLNSADDILFSDIASWTALRGVDFHSISKDPIYISDVDLHAQSGDLFESGTPFPSVTTDFDGEIRSETVPMIGADEFTPAICLPPTNIYAYEIYADSIGMTWMSGTGVARHIEYGPEGYERGTGTLITGITDTLYMLTGLTPQTTYDIYLRDYCDVGDSSIWRGPVAVRTSCVSQLSGVYTIDYNQPTGGANYASFSAAAYDLNDCGVSGPVVFNVVEGTYNDSLRLMEIAGVSEVNTITFQPDPSNTNPVILQDSILGEKDNFVVQLNGTDHLVIRGLTITAKGTAYGRVIEFKGFSDYVTIENNILNCVAGGTSNNIAVIVQNTADEGILTYTTIKHNEINNGSFGIYLSGSSGEVRKKCVIDSNTIRNFTYCGVYSSYGDSSRVRGNLIESSNLNTTVYGIRLRYDDFMECTGNTIISRGRSTNYGIETYYSDGVSTVRNLLANNMISLLDNTGSTYGIKIERSSYTDIVHNSVLINAGSAAGRGLYITAVSSTSNLYRNNRVFNNSIVNSGPGLAVVFDAYGAQSVSEMDYNNLYSAGQYTGSFAEVNVANLNGWIILSGRDSNSVSGDPLYVSNEDLHALGQRLNRAGTPLSGVTTDIDGDIRSTVTPDIGADEFTTSPCLDLTLIAEMSFEGIVHNKVTAYWTSQAGATYKVEYGESGYERGKGTRYSGIVDSFQVVLGLTPSTTYDVYLQYACDGANDTSLWIGPFSFTTSCAPVSTFPWIENFETSEDVIPACWINETDDDADWVFTSGDIGNGSTVDHTTGTDSGYYAAVDDSHLDGQDTINSLLTPLFDLRGMTQPQLSFWYYIADADMTSGMYIDIFDGEEWINGVAEIRFSVEEWLKDSVNLSPYVSSTTRIRFRAMETSDIYSDLSIDDIMIIDAPVSCNAAPADLSAENITCSEAELIWTSASAVSNSVVEYGLAGFTPGTGTSLTYVSSPQTISNLVLGTDYEFYVYDTCSVGSTTDTIGPVSFTTLDGPLVADYSFVQGVATATEMNVTFDASASEGASSYTWDFGDGSPAGSGVTVNHNYTTNGTYTVTLTITGDCGTATKTSTVTISGIGLEDNILNRSLSVYPNPTRGEVHLSFNTGSSESVEIAVTDLSGRLVISRRADHINGTFDEVINLEQLATGAYLLKIKSGDVRVVRRIIRE